MSISYWFNAPRVQALFPSSRQVAAGLEVLGEPEVVTRPPDRAERCAGGAGAGRSALCSYSACVPGNALRSSRSPNGGAGDHKRWTVLIAKSEQVQAGGVGDSKRGLKGAGEVVTGELDTVRAIGCHNPTVSILEDTVQSDRFTVKRRWRRPVLRPQATRAAFAECRGGPPSPQRGTRSLLSGPTGRSTVACSQARTRPRIDQHWQGKE